MLRGMPNAHKWAAGVLPVGVALLLAAAVAQEVTRNPKANALNQPEVVQGRALFQTNCAACHGPNAGGGMGPNLLASSLVRHDVKGDEIGKLLQVGRLEKGMPAFPQLVAQAPDIAAFVHARIGATMRASALGASAFGGDLNVGDAAAGKVYFQAHCQSCHDPAGGFQSIATRHDPAELEGLMLAPTPGKPTGTVTLAGGVSASGEVLHADAFTTTLRLPDGSVHDFSMGDGSRFQPDDPLRAHRDLLSGYTNADIHNVFAYLETLR